VTRVGSGACGSRRLPASPSSRRPGRRSRRDHRWHDGVLYIAASGNARVRAVAIDGVITTVAGPENGLVRPSALAVHPDGSIYIADSGTHRIYKLVR